MWCRGSGEWLVGTAGMDYGLWEGRGKECQGDRLRVGRAEGRGRGGRRGRLPERMVPGGGREGGEYPSGPAFLQAVSQETRQGGVEGNRVRDRHGKTGTRWGRMRGFNGRRKEGADILFPPCSLMAFEISACKTPGLFRRAFTNTVIDRSYTGRPSNETKMTAVLEA